MVITRNRVRLEQKAKASTAVDDSSTLQENLGILTDNQNTNIILQSQRGALTTYKSRNKRSVSSNSPFILHSIPFNSGLKKNEDVKSNGLKGQLGKRLPLSELSANSNYKSIKSINKKEQEGKDVKRKLTSKLNKRKRTQEQTPMEDNDEDDFEEHDSLFDNLNRNYKRPKPRVKKRKVNKLNVTNQLVYNTPNFFSAESPIIKKNL